MTVHPARHTHFDPRFRSALRPVVGRMKTCRDGVYTLWGHSVRVARRSHRIACALGLAEPERSDAYLGGLFHDAGKPWLDRHVLFKRGPLDPAEREHTDTHPARGAAALRDCALRLPDDAARERLSRVVAAVLHHHERWDGRGYPAGLAGPEIPLAARIVGLADWYEALVEPRTYRPGFAQFTEAQALAIIAEETAGRRFDPTVSEAFFADVARAAPLFSS